MINKDKNTAETNKKILNFEDAPVWQDAVELAASVYLLTSNYPKEEVYGLVSQMRRATTSVSANLAEGFGRSGQKEKIQFYSIAYGSLLEVKSFLYVSKRLGFIEDLSKIIEQVNSLQRQINAIKKRLKKGAT